jgi:hypothetical protein
VVALIFGDEIGIVLEIQGEVVAMAHNDLP